MKTKTLILFFTACSIIFGILACKNVPPEDQAAKMLKNFYTSYLGTYSKHLLLNIENSKIDSIKKVYCTPKLLNYILSIDELDYDPFLNAQMIDIRMLETLTIKKDSAKNDIYYVSYTYGRENTIKLSVLREGNGYKIDHIFLKNMQE